jgi:tyrosyl-tRNA synthetase
MKLSEELSWRGFVNQTTLANISDLDNLHFNFYLGIDPSSDSMTVGNLAMAMMVKHFIAYGHSAWLLVGGATGMIGDPDGKKVERHLLTKEALTHNRQALVKQYNKLFSGEPIRVVDNYDWFKDYAYLDFLRDVGKHVPMRQMLARDFVETRLGDQGSGISYAEFSYVLIQAYDFLYLYRNHGVNMQVCGSDQWGNSIAGVDLIRRVEGGSAHVWSGPLVVNPKTGVKFGKTEAGAIWLDPDKTSPTEFYQFWVTCEDETVEYYLKIFTLLTKDKIASIMDEHHKNPKQRKAQFYLADSVTELVHGREAADRAKIATSYLIGTRSLSGASSHDLNILKSEIPCTKSSKDGSIIEVLVSSGLAASNSQARKLIEAGAIYLNGDQISRTSFKADDFVSGRLLLRRGKAYRDSALIEI